MATNGFLSREELTDDLVLARIFGREADEAVLSFAEFQPERLLIKRLIDLLLASLMLVFTFPLMLLVALLIKLDSPGGIIYRSTRVGKSGGLFECLKFRTMLDDAEKRKRDIEHLNERDGVLFKVSDDPRVTRVGRFLRRSSIDELPQLWNVLRGEMSLVGPRPPLPEECANYTSTQLRRLSVIPGITGLWQVTARQDPSFEAYVKYDLEYIADWSIGLDLKILLMTIPAILKCTGS